MNGIICSADHYFENLPGGYKKNFDFRLLGEAHGQCLKKFLKYLLSGRYDCVRIMSGIPGSGKSYLAKQLVEKHPYLLIVDNTNLSAWEISPYLNLATAYNCKAEVTRVTTPLEVCLERQTHGVPEKKIREMFKRFERKDYMPWWPVKEVSGVD